MLSWAQVISGQTVYNSFIPRLWSVYIYIYWQFDLLNPSKHWPDSGEGGDGLGSAWELEAAAGNWDDRWWVASLQSGWEISDWTDITSHQSSPVQSSLLTEHQTNIYIYPYINQARLCFASVSLVISSANWWLRASGSHLVLSGLTKTNSGNCIVILNSLVSQQLDEYESWEQLE